MIFLIYMDKTDLICYNIPKSGIIERYGMTE